MRGAVDLVKLTVSRSKRQSKARKPWLCVRNSRSKRRTSPAQSLPGINNGYSFSLQGVEMELENPATLEVRSVNIAA